MRSKIVVLHLSICVLASPLVCIAQSVSRTETVEYYDDTDIWVLNQVKRTTTNGIETLRSEYDPSYALPTKSYTFGKLRETLSYDLTSAVSTGQRGTVKAISDGNGNSVVLTSWRRGVPQKIDYPATPDQPTGESKSATVNDDGTIASVTDENGYTTSYDYDSMGRLGMIHYPVGDSPAWKTTGYSFTLNPVAKYGLPAGHWRLVVDTGDARKITYFDALWRPVVEESYDNTNPANTRVVVAKRYDLSGRLVFQSYPLRTFADYSIVVNGRTTTYDALDRVKTVSIPSADGVNNTFVTLTSYLSNADGPYTLVTDPNGNHTRTWYQMFDQPDYSRPVTVWHPEGVFIDIDRDVFGKPLSITRRNGAGTISAIRTYAYNAAQELCRTVEPEIGATLMGYDAASNLAWSAAGYSATSVCGGPGAVAARRVDRTYDARNRLKTLVFPNHIGDTTTSYTPDSQVSSLVTDNGSGDVVTTAYTYNRRRLLIGERMMWSAINWPIQYNYDANGNAASLTYPDGTSIDYAPNALGQATKVGSYATGVTYHPNGAIAQFTYGNSIVHTMTQNDRQLPDRSLDAYSGGTPVIALDNSYSYDGNGNVLAILDGMAGAPTERIMEYDGLDRLTKATSPMFSDGAANEARYGYDVLDNIRTVHIRDRHQFYCYDEASWRLTFVRSGATCTGTASPVLHALDYDVRGNLASKDNVNYIFDYGNRLRNTTNGVVSSYVYDGLGRRVRDYTTASKYSLYSQDGRVLYVSNARNGKAQTNIYLGNSLLAEQEKVVATGVTSVRYLHTDALGSVASSSSQGRGVTRNDYEPYGKPIVQPRNDLPGYTGHIQDVATGLTYAQQRYYDSEVGRFLSMDPIAVDSDVAANFNRYSYASNNPYLYNDPDGRCGGWFCDFFGLQGTPETIRDKTYDRADAARGRDGQYLVGGYVAVGGGGALLGGGAVVLAESGLVATAATATSQAATTVNASVGIGVLKITQAAANQAAPVGNWISSQANQGYTSFMTSAFVSSGGNFSMFGTQLNAMQIFQSSVSAASETRGGGMPFTPSTVLGTIGTKVAKSIFDDLSEPPPPPPPSQLPNSRSL
jgi:RHS repeat-associated protein